jgi:hypothetical protein
MVICNYICRDYIETATTSNLNDLTYKAMNIELKNKEKGFGIESIYAPAGI